MEMEEIVAFFNFLSVFHKKIEENQVKA